MDCIGVTNRLQPKHFIVTDVLIDLLPSSLKFSFLLVIQLFDHTLDLLLVVLNHLLLLQELGIFSFRYFDHAHDLFVDFLALSRRGLIDILCVRSLN